MGQELEIMSTLWKDNFSMWLPAQCEIHLDVGVTNKKHYVVYLRHYWVAHSFWKAYLIQTSNDYSIVDTAHEWEEIKIFSWGKEEIEDAKQDALEEAVKTIKQIHATEKKEM